MTHRIVIVGGGAGGLELATRLGKTLGKRSLAKIVLVDANMTHIWKPLLHEVAAGSLNSTGDELNYVAQAKWNNFEFHLGRMCGLDRANKRIRLSASNNPDGHLLLPERDIAYDTLIMAVGSTSNDFGTPGAAEHCIFLDARKQADRFRRQLLTHYLRAQQTGEGQDHQVRVAIVGAGATGVELAAELRHASHELASYGLDRIKPDDLQITLIEAGPRVLPALPERLSRSAHTTLEKLGTTVMTGAAVKEITEDGMHTKDGQFIPAHLMVWAAGIRAPGFLKGLDGLETNRIDQLVVRPTLQTSLDDDIFAFGDCAACPQPDSDRPVPPRAQAAHQEASFLVRALKLRLEDKPLPEFRYQDYGSLISLSRFSAVGNLMGNLTGTVTLEGWLARKFYVSLYRKHQMALYGGFRTALMMLGGRFRRSTEPRLKLH